MTKTNISLETVPIYNPGAKNFIFGQSHFIKTVEDVHEALVGTVPGIQFGLAFCEASGPRLIRTSGTDQAMVELSVKNAKAIGCGHVLFIFLENAYPINVLPVVKRVPEVVRIFAATSNPAAAIVARTSRGNAVLGVIDGGSPLGVEKDADVLSRKTLLRKIGYKL